MERADPGRHVTGEKYAEYVYGTIGVMVAVAGLNAGAHDVRATNAVVVILIGALATWFAHAFSHLVGERVKRQGPVPREKVLAAFTTSWMIVVAALPATVVMVAAGLGLWSVSAGLSLANGIAIVSLAVVGVLVGRVSRMAWWPRVRYVLILTVIGTAIVALEAGAHRL